MKNEKKKSKRNGKKPKKSINKPTSMVPKLKGRGFYSGFSSDVGGMLGSGIGSLFGGSGIGKTIGSGLGSIFSKITGFGSYKVNNNTLMSDTGPPVFANGAEGSVIISRREFIGDVRGSIQFRNNVFQLNPSNPAMFPWLSSQTRGFEQYQILGMVIEYKPTSGNAIASTNNALGTVIMSTNYDVVDPPFGSKQEMENYQYTVSTTPVAVAIHPIECKPRLNVLDNLYLKQLSSPSSADPRFYDMGAFQLATVGMQADDITIGELWVSYHVKMLKPKFPDSNVIGFYAPAASNLLKSAADFKDNSNTVPSESTYCSVPFTATSTSTSGSINIKLNKPGNYFWSSWSPANSSSDQISSYVPVIASSTNVSAVGTYPAFTGVSNLYTQLVSTFNGLTSGNNGTVWTNTSAGTGMSAGSASSGGIYVGRGGGDVKFLTTINSDANASGHSLILVYQGYFDRSINTATYVPSYTDPNTSLNLALSRISTLELQLRYSQDEKSDDTFVLAPSSTQTSSSNSATSSSSSLSTMSKVKRNYL